MDNSEQALIHSRMVRGRVRVNYAARIEAQVEVPVKYGRLLGRSKRARKALKAHEEECEMFFLFQAFEVASDM